MLGLQRKIQMPHPDHALPGRSLPLPISNRHYVNDHPLRPPSLPEWNARCWV